jgi:hypothetical protein
VEDGVTVWRVAIASLAVALAAAAFALAHDVGSWSRAIDRGDARFAAQPAVARWSAQAWLPRDPARDALDLADDLALRRGEQAFRVAVAAPRGVDNGADRARLRAAAVVLLTDMVANGSREQASRAGNLLGILAATGDDEADAAASERRAAETFEVAVRSFPAGVEPKYNLELLLRRIRVVGSREGPGSGSGTRGDSRQGAGAGAPGSGY